MVSYDKLLGERVSIIFVYCFACVRLQLCCVTWSYRNIAYNIHCLFCQHILTGLIAWNGWLFFVNYVCEFVCRRSSCGCGHWSHIRRYYTSYRNEPIEMDTNTNLHGHRALLYRSLIMHMHLMQATSSELGHYSQSRKHWVNNAQQLNDSQFEFESHATLIMHTENQTLEIALLLFYMAYF